MLELGKIIVTKKAHVCGSNEWKIIRMGADVKLECVKCQRIIMMPMYELEKKIKKVKIDE